MRILYIAPVPIDFNNIDGVAKKIIRQAISINKEIPTDILSHYGGKVFLYDVLNKECQTITRGKSKIDVLKATRSVIKSGAYGGVYIRYPKSDLIFLNVLKMLNKMNITVVVEIPTFPYDLEGFETFKGRIVNYIDRICRKQLWKYVSRIVTFSDDDTIFGVKTIKTINGIDFENISPDYSQIDISEKVYLIAVSAMFRVHGYERIINGLNTYYKNGGDRNIILKLVGDGDECDKYKKLVTEFNLESHVIFYGNCFGYKLDNIYMGNAVGINSLAIHRQGLKKESTLKTKEYAAKGLPIISSSYVDAFSVEGNEKYVMLVPPDETEVNIENLLLFVSNIYDNSSVSSIRDNIRKDGENTCDINLTMKPIIEFYKKESQ